MALPAVGVAEGSCVGMALEGTPAPPTSEPVGVGVETAATVPDAAPVDGTPADVGAPDVASEPAAATPVGLVENGVVVAVTLNEYIEPTDVQNCSKTVWALAF